jgi:hypothetical protein
MKKRWYDTEDEARTVAGDSGMRLWRVQRLSEVRTSWQTCQVVESTRWYVAAALPQSVQGFRHVCCEVDLAADGRG